MTIKTHGPVVNVRRVKNNNSYIVSYTHVMTINNIHNIISYHHIISIEISTKSSNHSIQKHSPYPSKKTKDLSHIRIISVKNHIMPYLWHYSSKQEHIIIISYHCIIQINNTSLVSPTVHCCSWQTACCIPWGLTLVGLWLWRLCHNYVL